MLKTDSIRKRLLASARKPPPKLINRRWIKLIQSIVKSVAKLIRWISDSEFFA